MSTTRSKTPRGRTRTTGEWAGDLTAWIAANAENNDEQLSRLYRNLKLAKEQELTVRQRQELKMFFEEHMSVSEIAQELNLHVSTVSRTLNRAKKRLYRSLRYSL